MEIPVHTCSYKGGMNKDISPNEYPNTCYFDAKNLRVVVDNSDGLSTAALSSPKGNSASFTLPSGMIFLGYTVLRDYLIILAHKDGGAISPDKVYKILLSQLTTATNITITDTYYWTDPTTRHLVYEGSLGFNSSYPIKVVGNYENADIQKIYWVDGLNTLKHLNTVYNATYNKLDTLDEELLEILPNHTYASYSITEGIGGHLKAGRIQYSYQLYSVSGSETMFAPPSNLYNITSYNSSDGIEFAGNNLETVVNKYLKISLTFSSTDVLIFNRIRLVALQYEAFGDIPVVRVVSEKELSSTTAIFYDYGDTIGELLLEEFQVTKNDFIPATIESKNNYLFAGNITEEYFDIDEMVSELPVHAKDFLDTRAYRWRYITNGTLANSTQQLTQLTDLEALEDESLLGSNSWVVQVLYLQDDMWNIKIKVGGRLHATVTGPPARTYTGVQSIDSTMLTLRLFDPLTATWESLWLTCNSPQWFAETTEDASHDWIQLTGTTYFATLPSSLPAYTTVCCTDLIYTYGYSYTAVASTYESIVNKGTVGNSVQFTIDNGTTVNFDVPVDHDCINTYNNIANDLNVNRYHDFKFKQLTGAVPTIADLGGTGPYISFGFTYTDIIAGEKTTKGAGGETLYLITPTAASPGYSNQQYVLDITGYPRDEVIRVGIDFYDLKGRPSYAKWIADIRMPDISEELNPATTYSDTYRLCVEDTVDATGIVNARILGIQITIDWDAINTDYPDLLTQLSGFQIIRCQRGEDDSTIKASGLILPTHNHTPADGIVKDSRYSTFQITSAKDYNDNVIIPITGITCDPPDALNSLDKTLVELISPEVAFNKKLNRDSSDFLEVIGYIDNITKGGDIVVTVTPLNGSFSNYSLTATTITPIEPTPSLTANWRKTVEDSFISLPEARSPVTHIINSVPFTARGYDDNADADATFTYKGTTLVAGITSAFTNVPMAGLVQGDEKAMFGRYRRYLSYSIYGGSTYTERAYSEYIKAGEFTTIPTLPVGAPSTYNIYGGDTYINIFSFLKLFPDMDAERLVFTGQVIVTFPVESKINISHRLDRLNHYSTVQTNAAYYLSEKQSNGVGQYPNGYPEVGDLYKYNSAYSAENISKTFMTKPFDFRSTKTKDNIVTSSEIKINGEYTDSWLKFKYNNYIELEGEYGAITKLITHNDKLVAFQPRAIASLSVLDRELVESNNTTTLAVGTGGILSRYDYISRQVGTSLYDAICLTELGLYFYSDKLHSIYRIVDTLEPVSDTKGLKTYFESTPYTSCLTAYDKDNREVLFTKSNTTSLVFSGYIDAFEGFFTFYPTKYITFDKYLLSSLDNNKFYLHNVGNYNEYYGVLQTSELTLVVNPIKNNTVTFSIIEWLTDLTVSGIDDLITTFNTLRITNTHQDTGTMTLSTRSDLKRRLRKWRLNTFRDQTLEGGIACDKKIRDSWIKAIFTWTQSIPYKKLIIHPISFIWTPTKL